MAPINLRRLLQRKDVSSAIQQLLKVAEYPLSIRDLQNEVMFGVDRLDLLYKHPIEVNGESVGWVMGIQGAEAIATLVSHLITQELEKRLLAQETLDRYKEITLLYNLSERMGAKLDLPAVADLLLDEAHKFIQGSSGAMVLLNPATGVYESIATFGETEIVPLQIQAGVGVIGSILLSGIGEIINDIAADSRCIAQEACFSSLICAPLKSQEEVLGLIYIASQSAINYTAADLKLFNALASQASYAIENALLHKNKLKEERIKSNLERYVPSQVVQAILDSQGDVSLAPTRKDITILFSDIRNFTTQCEELSPEEIVRYLNEYFTQMVEVIFSHQGTVNKFVGDMIVALFGAPSPLVDSEKRAIETAIEMQKRLRTLPTQWIRDNFNTGIGISSGRVVVGNIGSPRHMDYTAIGDEVNTASRLQSIAKGGQILITRSIYEKTKADFQFQSCGSIKVKGKKYEVEVFEVVY
ncbi:MAG: GAF domain-containing protein [Scytolyngbya sp. HA4215-MV1]|jgi:class 3 adenylate cyclase|nr:GAF domain-containing protein [Scytolyngbya sp. HA4215-MV1]